jgi:octaprenyl-diphosphate synthase
VTGPVTARVTSRERAPVLGAIQAPVRRGLETVEAELWRIVDDGSAVVGEVSHPLVGMKGKLFRPTLLLLANAIDDRPTADATTLGAILELVHLATLVHDDAVDHSALRRGMPTLNSLLGHQVSVIAGDFLYLRALKELARIGNMDFMRVLTNASDEMTRGELRQLIRDEPLSSTEADYDELIRAKTASLFRAACELGALCGAPAYREPLARYGERLGMAFQVTDDLLDYTAAQEVTGKPSGLDLREHKMTLPLIAALPCMDPSGRARVEAIFSDETPGDADIAEVIGLVADAGGLEYARRRGEEFAAEAEQALDGLPDTAARTALVDAIGYVLARRS